MGVVPESQYYYKIHTCKLQQNSCFLREHSQNEMWTLNTSLFIIQAETSKRCWDKALELNDQYFDAKYSKAFCYEELGQYVIAYSIWNEIAETLDKEGLEYEAHHARDNVKRCIDREFIK